jgi:formate hydrogenlyase subunit 4
MSLVNLLVHLYLGDAHINENQYPALLNTISLSLYISVVCVVLASFFSAFRGREAKNKR